jgi:hypothetical protein
MRSRRSCSLMGVECTVRNGMRRRRSVGVLFDEEAVAGCRPRLS